MLKAAINDAEMPKGSRKNPLLLQGNTLQAPDRHRSMMANACVGKKNEAQKADPSHHIGGFHTPKHLKTSQNTSDHLRTPVGRTSQGTCAFGILFLWYVASPAKLKRKQASRFCRIHMWQAELKLVVLWVCCALSVDHKHFALRPQFQHLSKGCSIGTAGHHDIFQESSCGPSTFPCFNVMPLQQSHSIPCQLVIQTHKGSDMGLHR